MTGFSSRRFRGVAQTGTTAACRLLLAAFLLHTVAHAAEPPPAVAEALKPEELKRMPLEQLVDVKITSVSRRPESLLLSASAIGVVTADDIRRSGVENIPDALRLATGVHVAQIDGHTWAISSRGFNVATANKMQVLMDGRSVYTPLYSGVFWDVQQTFLPDIEQIEVIRGPGATLWGANAVNGVINLRTKSAQETQGVLLHGGAGNEERGFGGVRYGGKSGNTFYRVYGMHVNRDDLTLEGGQGAQDDQELSQAGIRMDSDLSEDDLLTLQGDIYTARFGQLRAEDAEAQGGNFIARWTRNLEGDDSIMLQAYFDRTHRLIPAIFEEDRDTFDLESQHQFAAGEKHQIVWGLNYRASKDEIGNLGPELAFVPEEETLHVVSGYLQDEMQVIQDRLWVTLGSKLEYNTFSGVEVQPTARFALRLPREQTLWGAVSRAVRTPTRIDQDLVTPNPASGAASFLTSSRDFESEEVIAYELGYRIKPAANIAIDLALFYHDYENLRSLEPSGARGQAIRLQNKNEGESYGAELEVKWQPTSMWQLQIGYRVMETEVRAGPGGRDVMGGRSEGNDPNHILVARSSFDLPGNTEFDAVLRYVDRLPDPHTPAYVTLDLRLAWEAREGLELALVGRNLLNEHHPEFRGSTVTREVNRSIFGTLTWQF